jgi:hypothetical protein
MMWQALFWKPTHAVAIQKKVDVLLRLCRTSLAGLTSPWSKLQADNAALRWLGRA